jgi:hypothetical protein
VSLVARYDSIADKNGDTRRERNEAFEVESPEPEIPDEAAHIWDWYWDIRRSQAPGMSGPVPISNQEFRAWLDLTGNIVTRDELDILKNMDVRFCGDVAAESEEIRERERDS